MNQSLISQSPDLPISISRINSLCRLWDLTTDPLTRFALQQLRDRFIKPARADQTHRLGRQVCQQVADQLSGLGFSVAQTTHKAAFDLWVNDCLHVEVKAANWTLRSDPRYGRYQAHLGRDQLRHADLLIFGCLNGSWHYFVIPPRQITGRQVIITSYDVYQYQGRYAPYLEAWPLVKYTLQTTRRCRQLHLPGGGV